MGVAKLSETLRVLIKTQFRNLVIEILGNTHTNLLRNIYDVHTYLRFQNTQLDLEFSVRLRTECDNTLYLV